MSSALGNVVIAIKAVDEASGVFDKIQTSLGVLGGSLGQLGGGFKEVGSVISGFAAGGVVGAAVAGVTSLAAGLKDAVQQAMISEDVWNRLKVTVENAGLAWENIGKSLRSFAESMMQVSRFSDEQIAAALKTMMDYGMDLDTAMKSMAATMDLATAKQIDLETAATAVARAFDGQETYLRRMGVLIDDSVPKSERFAAALGLISERFGGAAQADLDTYAGKWANFMNKWNELMERVGSAILPFLTKIVDGLIFLVDKFTAFWNWLVGGSLWPDLWDLVVTIATGGMNKLLALIPEALAGIVKIFTEWGEGITTFFTDLWNGLVEIVSGAFKGIWDTVNAGVKGVTDFFGNLWKNLVGGSIWTDMWSDMIKETQAGLSEINRLTEAGLGGFEAPFSIAAQGAAAPGYVGLGPATTNVNLYITLQSLAVGDKTELSRFFYDLQRQVVEAVRSAA